MLIRSLIKKKKKGLRSVCQ